MDNKGRITFSGSEEEEQEDSFSFEAVRKEVKELVLNQSFQRRRAQDNQENGSTSSNGNDTNADNITNVIRDTATRIHLMMDNINREIGKEAEIHTREYLYNLIGWNHSMLEEMKAQCDTELQNLTSRITRMLNNNASKEDELKRTVTRLRKENEDLQFQTQYLDKNYERLLMAADKKVRV